MRRLIAKISGVDRAQELMRSLPGQDGVTFLRRSAAEFGVQAKVVGTPVALVEPTIFFSTHHTGAVDFLTTYPALSEIAPRLKVVANKDLLALKPLSDILIPVNTISTGRANAEARQEIIEHLRSGGNLLVYPAGKVGTMKRGRPFDFPWRTGIAEILKDEARAAVPIYVAAKNAKFYYAARRVFPKLGLVFLMSALTWRRDRGPIEVRVGTPIGRDVFEAMNPTDILALVRTAAYAMA